MKSTITIVFVIIFAFSFCKGKGKQQEDVKAPEVSHIISNPLPAYRQYVQQLDTNDIHSVSKASTKRSANFLEALETE